MNADTVGHAGVELAIDLLRRVELFADLNSDELQAVARTVRRRRYPKGSIILAQDQPGGVGFLIITGSVDVLLESEDGRQFIAARLGPGDHFGEMALLDEEPRSATIMAGGDTDLLLMRRDEFLEELLRHPQIGRAHV